MRTKTIKRTGEKRKIIKPTPLTVVIDDKKLAEFVASRMYKIRVSFNMRHFECETDDLKSAILSLKPSELLTEMYITITKGGNEFEQRLDKVTGNKLFRDQEFLDIYLNKIML